MSGFRVYIFGTQHCPVDFYQVCTNTMHQDQNQPCPRSHLILHSLGKNLKISCQKQYGLDLEFIYLGCSIVEQTSIKIVQIMAKVSKLAPPFKSFDFTLNKTLKIFFSETTVKCLELRCVLLLCGPPPSLFKS